MCTSLGLLPSQHCVFSSPHRTRAPPSSPVLAYREIVEHPCLQPPNIRVIREVLEAVTGEDKRKAEWRENAVPLEDPREDKHKAAEEEVRDVLCLRGVILGWDRREDLKKKKKRKK